MSANTIIFYTDANGRTPFKEWRLQLRDGKAKTAVERRLFRAEMGNFGDCKPLRDGVWEMRIDVGPGYRMYYAKAGSTIVLLLCGGDKRTQSADIDKACAYFADWRNREDKS